MKKTVNILKSSNLIRKVYVIIRFLLDNFLSRLLSFVTKIKSNKIVICSYHGKGYGDNPKYIVEELIKSNEDLEIYWLSKNYKLDCIGVSEKIKFKKYNYFSLLYHLVTSKVWIDNCRKEMFFYKSKKQLYIQTWHGNITFKNCENAALNSLSYNYVKMAKRDSKITDYFISSSKFTNQLYKEDFWYDGDILMYGSPRNDILINLDLEKISQLKKKLKIPCNKKILLYAPTFRKNKSLSPYNIDLKKLLKSLKKKFNENFIILVRLHPNISEKSKNFINYTANIVNVSNYPDMQELLLISDIMITDYSSSIFDFAISRKPAFIYASDIDDYKKDRNFKIDICDSPFDISRNNDELFKCIENFDLNKYTKNVNSFFYSLGLNETGKASFNISNIIVDFIKKGNTSKINKSTKTLAFNTIMLYVMQVSTFIFPLLTFPFLTRKLGTENYGIVVFTNAVMTYFQMFIDFGFLLSGTEKCSKERNNKEMLSKITSSIIYGKLILSVIGLFAIIFCSIFLNIFEGKELFIIFSYIPLILTSFVPDYLFRGIEKMGTIATRTIISKVLYTLVIFLFIKGNNDYYYIPLATFVSNLLIVIWSWKYIKDNLDIKLKKVSFNSIKDELKSSSTFFASRIATTAYSASNIFVLGLFGYSDATIGIYGSANNLISYGRAVFSPISDSLYPYMIKNKNFKLVNKILLILCPIIIVGCVILYFISDFVIKLMCGPEYFESVNLFRKMIPLIALTLPSYLYGFPMLGAIGKNNKANLTVIIGAIFHIMGLFILFVTKTMNFINVIYLTIMTELIILVLRIVFFNKYKPKMNKEKKL